MTQITVEAKVLESSFIKVPAAIMAGDAKLIMQMAEIATPVIQSNHKDFFYDIELISRYEGEVFLWSVGRQGTGWIKLPDLNGSIHAGTVCNSDHRFFICNRMTGAMREFTLAEIKERLKTFPFNLTTK